MEVIRVENLEKTLEPLKFCVEFRFPYTREKYLR